MNDKTRLQNKYKSTIHYVLLGLMPYGEASLKLIFKPSAFFRDIAILDGTGPSKKAIETAYYRSIKRGYISVDEKGIPRLTNKGIKKVRPYASKKLTNSSLMVVFDIPEYRRQKRDRLRLILKELSFQQVQKSVWVSSNDHREYLKAEIVDNDLQDYVKVFEVRQL